MKYLNKLLVLLIAATITTVGCSEFTSDTEPPINIITDEALNSEDQIAFLETGVIARFSQVNDNLSVIAGGLSDELQFDSEGNSLATFPTFAEIDRGDITFDNNSVDGPFQTINEARFLADDLIRRIGEIGTFEDASIRTSALYTANLVGGISRFWLGAYFGLTETVKGAPIDNSDIIPRADLYTQAIAKFDEALTHATPAQEKVVNSIKVKLYMSVNDYASAATVLQGNVLESGDAPFQSLYNTQSQNAWFGQAGEGRTQLSTDPRFQAYIDAEATEANRIFIAPFDENVPGVGLITYYYADYGQTGSIDFVTWQEMALARAEILNDNPAANVGAAGETPLTLINAVRASHSIPDFVGAVDQDVILEERDKELYATGNRLLDQLRTGNFHLQGGQVYTVQSFPQTNTEFIITATPWEHFPITSRERNNNPNFD